MTIKKIVCTGLLAISMCSVSVLAHAKLTIVNNTNKDSTSLINDGACSDSLPGGVTKAKSTNTVDDMIISFACWGTETNCKADVYMTNNCNKSGAPKIATVNFDIKKGIIPPIKNYTNEYTISGSGFNIQLDGGPALAKK